jgi:F0F1-type ATP synthase membrane subunit c/vacuolar-type H+-ATPase subunit K
MISFADATSSVNIAKGLMIGGGFIGPCVGMGIVGGSYIQATGRNPEARLLGQALVFVAIIELYALLAFASTFFMLSSK